MMLSEVECAAFLDRLNIPGTLSPPNGRERYKRRKCSDWQDNLQGFLL